MLHKQRAPRRQPRRPKKKNNPNPTLASAEQPNNCQPRRPSRRLPILPEGRLRLEDFWEWRSPDGTTSVWYVGFPEPAFRIWTGDPLRITRLRRLSRIEQYSYTVVGPSGPPEAGFMCGRGKLETLVMRRLLWGAYQVDPEEIAIDEGTGIPEEALAGVCA